MFMKSRYKWPGGFFRECEQGGTKASRVGTTEVAEVRFVYSPIDHPAVSPWSFAAYCSVMRDSFGKELEGASDNDEYGLLGGARLARSGQGINTHPALAIRPGWMKPDLSLTRLLMQDVASIFGVKQVRA
jgi:hypothetical protein